MFPKIARFFKRVYKGIVAVLTFLLNLLTGTVQRLMLLSTLLGAFALVLWFGYNVYLRDYITAGFSLVSAAVLIHLNKQF